MSGSIRGASPSWRRPARTTAINRGVPLPVILPPARPHRLGVGVVLILLGVLVGGCARPSISDPAKAELLRQIREGSLFEVDIAGLALLSVPVLVARRDPDTHLGA